MRFFLLFLIGLGLAYPLMAQQPAGEPSELNLQGEAPEPVAQTNETATASTNKTADPKLSFLISTGIQYAEEGEYKEAERAYLRALETDPNNSSLRFRLSTLYLLTDRYTEGVPILEELVAEYPDNAQVRNNLAWAYATGQGVKNTKMALRHAREAILLAPISSSMWNTLAEAYYVGGDYERALRASEHAINLLTRAGAGDGSGGLEGFQAQRRKILRAIEARELIEEMMRETD